MAPIVSYKIAVSLEGIAMPRDRVALRIVLRIVRCIALRIALRIARRIAHCIARCIVRRNATPLVRTRENTEANQIELRRHIAAHRSFCLPIRCASRPGRRCNRVDRCDSGGVRVTAHVTSTPKELVSVYWIPVLFLRRSI